jgi:putative transposase
MFVEIPPHIAVSDFVRRVKGRSSHQVQMELPDLRKRYWGRHFWARRYFSNTGGNIDDNVIEACDRRRNGPRQHPRRALA